MKEDNYYSTPDLPLAAAISLLFSNPDAIDRDRQKVRFTFRQTDELNEFLESYWRGDTAVEPQAYASKLRELKSRIHNG